MADKIWATIEEPIRRQIEKRQRLMLQNSNYKERVTYLNKKCDIRVTPLSYDMTNPGDYVNFFFNNDYIENTFTNSSYKSKIERPFIENFELISRTGDNSKVGVLRTGKMSIKIFTKDQFNKIEKYFRIGSALLIEWGWSNYVLNGGNTGYFKTHLYPNIETKMLREENILNHIETQTLESNGNYDGAIMFINNFSVNFENGVNDFYYTLNVDFVGKSLLINELFSNKTTSDGIKTAEQNSEQKTSTNPERFFTNSLINILRFIETFSSDTTDIDSLDSYQDITIDENTVRLRLNWGKLSEENKTTPSELKEGLYIPDQLPSMVSRYSGQSSIYSYNFIKLDYFLKLLNTFILSSTKINYIYEPNNQKYIISEYGLPKNGVYLNNVLLTPSESPDVFKTIKINSFDTRICVLPHQLPDKGNDNNINNIYLRVTYLKDFLINLLKLNEDFIFNNILAKILDDINRVTANELKLEYFSNDEKGNYTIISNSSSRTGVTNINDLLSLKIYNKSAVGSIVEEVNIDTTIDSKIANTIAIASLGQPLNEIPNESFGLLKFNKNIRSRLNIELVESVDKNRLITTIISNISNLNKSINSLLKFENSSLDNRGALLIALETFIQAFRTSNNDNIEASDSNFLDFNKDTTFTQLINLYKQIRTDIINLSVIDENVNTLPRNTPLIPVLYNFSMPGISGLYSTNLLKIDDQRLPDIYQTSNSYYIITGITHTINNREWKTSVKTNFQLS
jgi:hypothetical protein